ncbi:MAG: type II toxin-antitoxin system death-on-curing family toxin [Ardenticatenaceae bacterium]|nr:type II toxin-antitoxin system death-on-curing family toxin [Ardenticatenaceae bacterium]
MTVYLTATQILFIHARLIATTGGEHGVRDLGLLQSAAARPKATFDHDDLYPTLFQKAAALMASLAQNHPFVDGNKRTAITSSVLFLQLNGYSLQTTNAELERFTLSVVNERPSLTTIAAWFEAKCEQTST